MATISKIRPITDQILQAYDTIIINFITQMYLLFKKKKSSHKSVRRKYRSVCNLELRKELFKNDINPKTNKIDITL